jgi:hypothetical protein
MFDSERCRCTAAEYLKAANEARQPYHRRLYLLMAQTWLSLAKQDDLLASWGVAEFRSYENGTDSIANDCIDG